MKSRPMIVVIFLGSLHGAVVKPHTLFHPGLLQSFELRLIFGFHQFSYYFPDIGNDDDDDDDNMAPLVDDNLFNAIEEGMRDHSIRNSFSFSAGGFAVSDSDYAPFL